MAKLQPLTRGKDAALQTPLLAGRMLPLDDVFEMA